MTFRAVTVGLLGACFIAVAGHFNDAVARLPYLVGNHFPTSVFGLLFVAVILTNPLLRRIRASWAFRPPEFAVIVTFMLVACSIPAYGLMRYFAPATTMPIHLNKTMPGWQKYDLLGYVPPSMMVADKQADSKVLEGFINRSGEPGNPIGLSDVPWNEWSGPLTTWIPIIFLFALASICMSLIVHRQWSKHESLRYPIADFATTLMGEGPEKGEKSIFRNKLFWIGMGLLLAIHVVNGLYAWYPASVKIPLQFYFPGLPAKLPAVPRSWTLGAFRLYPTVIAFCFLVSSELGLSLGISQWVFILLAAPFVKAGFDFSENSWSGGVNAWQRFGSYVGIALIMLYTGRRYYRHVLAQAVFFWRPRRVEGYAGWACRILIASVVLLVVLLWALGLAWPLAAVFVALVLLVYLVIARVNAESGLFVMSPYWTPLAIVTGLFGVAALGPKAIIMFGLLSLVLTYGSHECLMPFLVNGLKMCDKFKVKTSRAGWGAVAAFAIALALAVPVILWANQNFGLQKEFTFTNETVPIGVFDSAQRATASLALSEKLEASKGLSDWERVTNMDPDQRFVWAAGIGLLLVVVFSALRLRFTWWPIHPILFAVWGSYSMGYFHFSFLIGWLIRRAVTKFGGVQKYRQVRILMFGVIAGELLGILIFMIIGAIYYARTGNNPPVYKLDPC